MNRESDRRLFLQAGASIAAASWAWQAEQVCSQTETTPKSANERIAIGVMGVNGRGGSIIKGMMARPNTEIAYVCDVDTRASERAAGYVEKTSGKKPKVVTDFRRVLDDKDVDVLIVATPNHWHAPATIMGCAAGKHVYVEKPCSYTAAEGEWAVQAARDNNRVVQMGSQRRTWPAIVEAIGKIHAGEIGKTLYARTWYNNRRGSIGIGKNTPVPQWLDWDLWQGPAPRRPYKDNVVHYNWHWHWHWGNGEIGNNGVHGIDVARWGLDVKYPIRVTAGGGKYRHEDDQETPDTMMVTIDFPAGKTITWEGLSWSPLGVHDTSFGISFHGTEGTIIVRGSGYATYDMQRKEVATQSGPGGDADHFQDFLDAIRNDRRPNADIQQAHRSTLLCHLGNIAYRTGTTLHTDPANGHILDNPAAQALWSREYAKDWEPKV
jgi:predicted dehydrogenase